MNRPRVLSVSTMFPNPRMPVHAQFVKQRLDALAELVDLTVVSPIPWFPGQRFFRKYGNRDRVPPSTDANAYPTYFPRFFSFPMILKPLDGFFVARAVKRLIQRNGWKNRFDLLDCHLAFPEGFAGTLLSRSMGVPFTVTLRGHDINDLHRFPMRARQVVFALRRCSRFFGVAQALVDGAVRMGAPREKGFASTNGVDAARFRPTPKGEARQTLGLDPSLRYMLSVSHLVPRKGVDILIEALSLLSRRGRDDLRFIIVGKGGEEGDCEADLRRQAEALGVADKVIWAGGVLNTDLHRFYSAADVFCLASEKEGWPNVVLEALACSTPVVAFATWGVPEILSSPEIGLLVQERDAEAFAASIGQALDKNWSASVLRDYAASHSWKQVAQGLLSHFGSILSQKAQKPE